MTGLKRERVALADFRNNMSKYLKRAEDEGIIFDITIHGRHAVSAILVDDLVRIEQLIQHLSEQAEAALALEQKQPVEGSSKSLVAREREIAEIRRRNKEIGELMKRAVNELLEGDPTLLREMATKYLES